MPADIYAVGVAIADATLLCGAVVNKVERLQIKLIRRSRALKICVPHWGVNGYVGLWSNMKS